jgi:hypothetical protein
MKERNKPLQRNKPVRYSGTSLSISRWGRCQQRAGKLFLQTTFLNLTSHLMTVNFRHVSAVTTEVCLGRWRASTGRIVEASQECSRTGTRGADKPLRLGPAILQHIWEAVRP